MRTPIIIFILSLFISAGAQEYSTSSKKAIALYENAMAKMQMREYAATIAILNDATKLDSNFTEAWLLMADAYDLTGNFEKVAESCKKAVDTGGQKYPVVYLFYANALFRLASYQEALGNIKIFLQKKEYTNFQRAKAEQLAKNCNFALNAMNNPVQFTPENLGNAINSTHDEYWPSLSADEEYLVFVRELPKDPLSPAKFRNRQEDIFISNKKEYTWSKAMPIGNTINSPDNEGSPFLTSDGMLMYFAGCNRPEGKGQCDIYVSEKINDGWSEPRNLGAPINTSASEKQPSVSSDGRTLYYSSNRAGSKGGFDIWYSEMDENGNWSAPKNMGDSINSPEVEQSPFIHPDNQSLYFSSYGHTGMGGSDIFMSKRKDNGEWGAAKNLGYPINTNADEIGFVVDAKAKKAYFSSNRVPENGKDLFAFDLPQALKPMAVSYFKGKIFDAETLKPLKAQFELIDINSNKTISRAFSNTYTGNFLLCLPANNEYALNVSKKTYLFYSDHFNLDSGFNVDKPFIKDIAMQPIKPGKTVILKNIFYTTGSFELRHSSEAELQKLEAFLKSNPELKIEISGHTDNVGEDKYNLALSEKRAHVVVDFLIQKGIEKERLIFKGYGETQAISDNKTPEGRAQNRRTEFKILP